MGRENQEPLSVWQIAKEHRKAFSTKDCLVPAPMKVSCSGKIVKAHTLTKSGSLKQIARAGHVYSFIPSLENMIKYDGRLQPELVHINRASTFTGFCSTHDNMIFSKIENQPFQGSQEQCFLLAYRAQAREIYNKKAQVSSSNICRQTDKGRSLVEQISIQFSTSAMNTDALAGLRDCEYHKEVHDKILLSRDFNAVRAYIIELEFPPPIMCSAGLFPEQDFDGNQLQDLDNLDVTLHLLNYTSFCSGNRGLIVFTWLPDSDPSCRPLIDTLRKLSPDRMTDALIRFFFRSCENLHIRPEWWENLADSKKNNLVDRLASAVFKDNNELVRSPGCIAEDGFRFDDWPISYTKAIGY